METIHLEKQGETLSFTSPEDEKTGRLVLELKLAPGKAGPPPHIHTMSDEEFEVISGTFVIIIDGEESVLKPGDKGFVKAGQAHTFRNGSDSGPVVVKGYIEPALSFKWFISEMAKSANENGGSWDDVSILQAGFILFMLRKEYRVSGIPYIMQDLIFGFLAALAKISGRARKISPRPVIVKK